MKRDSSLLQAQLTPCSGNTKTGPIPVSGTSSVTCPRACSLRGNGCYAEQHHLGGHWAKVSSGERGTPWAQFVEGVRALASHATIWRHNQFGDLPGEADEIDRTALSQLVDANADAGLSGWTYSHKPTTRDAIARMQKARVKDGLEPLSAQECAALVRDNRAAIADANARGFTVNVSCDTIAEVDQAWSPADWPTVAIVPIGAPLVCWSPGGRKIVRCPAQTKKDVDCNTCGGGRPLCQRRDRDYVIGFEAHGAMRKKVSLRVMQ